MSLKPDRDWWKRIFDETYLMTDARTVCDEELTCREVDFIVSALGPGKSAPILDLCGGQGRHSLELSRRDYKDVTVLDYSEFLTNAGAARARSERLGTIFIQGDARDTRLAPERFLYVIIMGSSFGYFMDEDENARILIEACRLLRPGGAMLLDLPDMDYVINNFRTSSTHSVDSDVTVRRARELEEDVIISCETVSSASKGLIREITYCTRLYGAEKIERMLKEAGFGQVSCHKEFMRREGDFGTMTNRMVVMAVKRQV